MSVIVDAAVNDATLSHLLCSANASTCRAGRVCALDTVLTSDVAISIGLGCPPEGCWVCLHKTLLPPAPQDFLGTALLFVGGTLAGASGIGGGGLNVPIMMLVLHFIVLEAVPLSHIMVLGNAVAQNIVNLSRAHPLDRRRPLVDFNAPLILLPMQLGGNALGLLLSPALPSTVLVLFACLILIFAAGKTIRRGIKDFRAESQAGSQRPPPQTASWLKHCDSSASVDSTASGTELLEAQGGPTSNGRSSSSASPGDTAETPAAARPKDPSKASAHLDSEAIAPKAALPWVASPATFRLALLAALWVAVNAIYFLERRFGGLGRCSPAALAWKAALIGSTLLAAIVGVAIARRAPQARVPLPGDLQWDNLGVSLSAMLVHAPLAMGAQRHRAHTSTSLVCTVALQCAPSLLHPGRGGWPGQTTRKEGCMRRGEHSWRSQFQAWWACAANAARAVPRTQRS